MAEDTKFDRREFQISRIRETARQTAHQLRKIADDIDRIADKDDYIAIPYEVMETLMWGIANARPSSPAQQLRELMISDQANAVIAAREAAEAPQETAEEIADRIAGGRSIAGFSGISDNTRRIVRRAILRAVKAAQGIPCEECGRIEDHKFDCTIGRAEATR